MGSEENSTPHERSFLQGGVSFPLLHKKDGRQLKKKKNMSFEHKKRRGQKNDARTLKNQWPGGGS